jgi:hypothetical protein
MTIPLSRADAEKVAADAAAELKSIKDATTILQAALDGPDQLRACLSRLEGWEIKAACRVMDEE